MATALTIATRGSPLALRQAQMLRARLAALMGRAEDDFPFLVVKTTGDRFLSGSLQDIGGKGLFTKEIDEALLAGCADLAVHSAKDLPAALPHGLQIAAVLPRADPRDALISRNGAGLAALKPGARVGTASLRRRAQLKAHRPDLEPVLLRGNVGTRLAKLESGAVDAVLLALAGLQRLGLDGRVSEILDPQVMLPAPAQGVIAVVARSRDAETCELLARVNDQATHLATLAERALSAGLDASCRTPIAALTRIARGRIHLRARLIAPAGRPLWEEAGSAPATPEDATALGRRIAELLRAHAGEAFFAALAEGQG